MSQDIDVHKTLPLIYEILFILYTRDLLRFSSQTNNLGMADFRPILDRNQWEWHSCHNHWHSFEAFIHYDLLNITTGEKVAEGHKASFCLEDSTCDGGSTRYMHCTGVFNCLPKPYYRQLLF